MSGGGGSFNKPMGSTSFEDALMTQQRAALRQQQAMLQQMFGQAQEITEESLEAAGFNVKTTKDGVIKAISPKKGRKPDPSMAAALEMMGFDLHINRNGEIKRITGGPDQDITLQDLSLARMGSLATTSERQNREALNQRLAAALGGEIASPGLERDLEQQRLKLEESLQRRMGPGYAQSTAGLQALQRFDESANAAREQARNAQISQAGSLANALGGRLASQDLQRFGMNQQAQMAEYDAMRQNALANLNLDMTNRQQALGLLTGMPNQQGNKIGMLQSALAPMGMAGNFLAQRGPQAFLPAMAPFQQMRANQMQAAGIQAQMPSTFGALGGLTGTLGGAFLGGPGFARLFGR